MSSRLQVDYSTLCRYLRKPLSRSIALRISLIAFFGWISSFHLWVKTKSDQRGAELDLISCEAVDPEISEVAAVIRRYAKSDLAAAIMAQTACHGSHLTHLCSIAAIGTKLVPVLSDKTYEMNASSID